MLYISIYSGFLLIVSLLYYFVRDKSKHFILLASSILFIAYISWKFALFAVIFSCINYYFGLQIENHKQNITVKRRIFWIAIFVDIGILAFFKYNNFLNEGLNALYSVVTKNSHWVVYSIVIPLGISYYTFQALGYLIRINRGSEKAEKDFFKFVSFLVFFPKFISGPVERSNHFLPQLKNPGSFDPKMVSEGIQLFLWGVFKKIAIATNLYWPVHLVYSNVYNYTGEEFLLVFFVQTIYIYADFSGYTDMALGSAKILGINLVDNFNRPFLARNISEFWRRWHISLSSWCNDFIYNPFIVKYRKFENVAIIAGVFLTFLVIGVWHAANWTFVILGLMQGTAIVYEFFTKKYRLKLASNFSKTIVNTFSRIVVFLFVSVSMVFFFSPTLSAAGFFLSHLLSFSQSAIKNLSVIPDNFVFFLGLFCFAVIFMFEILNEKGR